MPSPALRLLKRRHRSEPITVLIVTETLVGTTKRGELREFLLCTILFVQLVRPLNFWIYDPVKRPGSDGQRA